MIMHKEIVLRFIPISKVLKLFFEISGVFKSTQKYLEDIQKNKFQIQNLVQGPLWKKKTRSYGNKITYPVESYFAD